jgi:hypothetical protein
MHAGIGPALRRAAPAGHGIVKDVSERPDVLLEGASPTCL